MKFLSGKPNKEGNVELAKKMGINEEDFKSVAVLGDHPKDIYSALNAGMQPIWVPDIVQPDPNQNYRMEDIRLLEKKPNKIHTGLNAQMIPWIPEIKETNSSYTVKSITYVLHNGVYVPVRVCKTLNDGVIEAIEGIVEEKHFHTIKELEATRAI